MKISLALSIFLSTAILASCGGGGSDPDTGASDSTVDYRAAYFKITTGMAPETVLDVVGTKPYIQSTVNGEVQSINWSTGVYAKDTFQVLTVIFEKSKASSKNYGGRFGEKYEQLNDDF